MLSSAGSFGGFSVMVCVLVLFGTRDAHAYVDPGIVGALYQYLYVVVFGLLTLLFTKPRMFLKDLLRRLRASFRSTDSD